MIVVKIYHAFDVGKEDVLITWDFCKKLQAQNFFFYFFIFFHLA